MKPIQVLIVLAFATGNFLEPSACAQSSFFTADIATVLSTSNDSPTPRFFQIPFLAPPTTNFPCPEGTVLWFMADTAVNGIEPNLNGYDDLVLWYDTVNGTVLGDTPGVFRRAGVGPFHSNFASFPIYVVVFSFTNTSGAIPGSTNGSGFRMPTTGDSYGLLNLGVHTPDPGGFSTVNWHISQNVYVPVVPEPSATTLGVSGLILLMVGKRSKLRLSSS